MVVFRGVGIATLFRAIATTGKGYSTALLLSATPVLHNEREFLAMLHLLSPEMYGLEDLEKLQINVQTRQEIGRVLVGLQPDRPVFLLKAQIQKLRELLPGDELLGRRMNDLEAVLDTGAGMNESGNAVREVRAHISEAYRLHRRMLRTRRAVVGEGLLLPRWKDGTSPVIEEWDSDDRSELALDAVERWRLCSVEQASSDREIDQKRQIQRVFSILLQAASSDMSLFSTVVRARLGQSNPSLSADFVDAACLWRVPLFEGERFSRAVSFAICRVPLESFALLLQTPFPRPSEVELVCDVWPSSSTSCAVVGSRPTGGYRHWELSGIHGRGSMSSSAARYFPSPLGKGLATNSTIGKTSSRVASAAQTKGHEEGASDEALVAKICSKDKEALALLFRRYSRLVRSVAFRILADSSEADDLLQDVFWFIHNKAEVFDSAKCSARSWIVQMTYHRAIDRRRYLQSRHFYTRVDLDGVAGLLDPRSGAAREFSTQLVGNTTIQGLLDTLTEDQRNTLSLYFVEGYTFDEIAAKLNQSLGNIRHHYYRGLDHLRKQMFPDKLSGGNGCGRK
jgi:RNA polymerase sigma-70 factor (ECF subfamily)